MLRLENRSNGRSWSPLVGCPRNKSRGLFLINLKKELDAITPD
jgi:hypothetical protein